MSQAVIKEKKGLRHEWKILRQDTALMGLLAVIIIVFLLFIFYPLAKIVFLPQANDWLRAFSERIFVSAFKNTIISSLSATLTAVIIGFIYAFALNYTSMPGKSFFRTIAILPLMAPSVITGLAFILLFGRRGFITYHLLNLKVDLYGPIGLWIVQSLAFFPLAYLTISSVLKSISPNLELAAQNLGAKGFYLFKTITFKLAMPGILSAFLLVAINSFADFGNPILVGGNYRVLATEAYMQVTGAWDMQMASVLSMLLVIPTLIVFIMQKYYLERRSYVTVTGKPVAGLKRNIVSDTGTWMLFGFCSMIALIITAIFVVIACFAFTKTFGINNTFTLANFYEVVFRSEYIKNSWFLSMIAALITAVFGGIIAFVVTRFHFPGRGMLDFSALLPVSLPGTFLGISYILAFNEAPFSLTGTAIILIIVLCMRQLPVSYRNAVAGFKQIDCSIEQASTNLGATSMYTFKKIVLPMLKNPFSVSLVYTFLKSMNTLSAVIFLVSPEWMLASVSILSLADHGYYGKASATAIGMIVVIFMTLACVKLVFKNKLNIFDL